MDSKRFNHFGSRNIWKPLILSVNYQCKQYVVICCTRTCVPASSSLNHWFSWHSRLTWALSFCFSDSTALRWPDRAMITWGEGGREGLEGGVKPLESKPGGGVLLSYGILIRTHLGIPKKIYSYSQASWSDKHRWSSDTIHRRCGRPISAIETMHACKKKRYL